MGFHQSRGTAPCPYGCCLEGEGAEKPEPYSQPGGGGSGRPMPVQPFLLPPPLTSCPQTTEDLGRDQQQHRLCEAEEASAAAF